MAPLLLFAATRTGADSHGLTGAARAGLRPAPTFGLGEMREDHGHTAAPDPEWCPRNRGVRGGSPAGEGLRPSRHPSMTRPRLVLSPTPTFRFTYDAFIITMFPSPHYGRDTSRHCKYAHPSIVRAGLRPAPAPESTTIVLSIMAMSISALQPAMTIRTRAWALQPGRTDRQTTKRPC